MIMTLGYIFAAILAFFFAMVVYHIIRGAIIGADLMRWKLVGATWSKVRATEGYKLKLAKMFFECWASCIGYKGQFAFSRGSKKWEGFGTGR